jgi:hypothetical protein
VIDSPQTPRSLQRPKAAVPDALALAAVVVTAIAAWYFRIILPAHVPFDLFSNSDFFTQIYPMWHRTSEWLRAGVLPLWNPYQCGGHPLLATGIYGVLYPPNLLYSVVPAGVAIEVLTVVHLAAAGMLMYAYARTICLCRTASLVAATTFMLSGFIVSQATWFPPALASAVWLPLELLAVERVFRRHDVSSAILLGLAVALAFLGGWPQTWMYGMYVVAVYGVGRSLVAMRSEHERPHVFRAYGLFAAAILFAFAWMAPQLLPSLELQALGPRRAGALSMQQTLSMGALAPSALAVTMVNAIPGPPRWAYLGISAVLLMPLSLVAVRQRWRITCFWLLAIFSLCVAVSVYTPVFNLYNLIGGSRFRAPPRALYIYAAAGAVLTGVGFEVLARLSAAPASQEPAGALPRRQRLSALVMVTTVAIAVYTLVAMPILSVGYLLTTVVLIWGALLMPNTVARRMFVLALAVFIVADLLASLENPWLHPVQNPHVFDTYENAWTYIKARQGFDRTYIKSLLDLPELMSKQGSLRGIYSITDYEPLSLSRYERFFRSIEAPKDQRPDYLTFTGTLHADPAWPEFRLLDLMSVRFVVVPKMDLAAHAAFARLAPKWQRTLFARERSAVYENGDPLPRAYVAQHTIVVPSEDAALAATIDPTFDPRTAVILEPEGTEVAPSAAPAPIVRERITRYEPSRVEVEVDGAPAAGYLVLTDTYYPGWQATVDGVPTPIVRANFLFRAVPIDAGKHTVVFTYAPRSFWLGVVAAMIASVAAAAGIAVERRRRGAKPGEAGPDTHPRIAASR